MDPKQYIIQRLQQIQLIARDLEMITNGINKYLTDVMKESVKIGQTTSFEGVNYEVIDSHFYELNYYRIEDIANIAYHVLLLKLIDGKADNSNLGKAIRRNKKWSEWGYSSRNRVELRKYHQANVITIAIKMFSQSEVDDSAQNNRFKKFYVDMPESLTDL